MRVLGQQLLEEEDEGSWEFRQKHPYRFHCKGEALKDVAKRAFFEQANLYKWSGSLGDYTIWAYKNTGEMSEAEHAWPHAFVGEESQTINAAMWILVNDEFKLVALWTFSVCGDETSVYYLNEYQQDVWAFSEACDGHNSPITSEASAEHFSVSSGDYEVESFCCYSLDIISASEMAAFEEEFKNQNM